MNVSSEPVLATARDDEGQRGLSRKGKLYRAGEHTIGELEELFAVTRSTVYRAIRRAGDNAADAGVSAPLHS